MKYRADFTPEEKLLWETAFQAGLKNGAEIAVSIQERQVPFGAGHDAALEIQQAILKAASGD